MTHSANSHKPPPGERGQALIVALAVLTLLSLTGVVFVTMARMERSAARSHVDTVRAGMLAESGIEAAAGALLAHAARIAFDELRDSWAFVEFSDTDGNSRFDPPREPIADVDGDGDGGYDPAQPLETAPFPSFKGFFVLATVPDTERGEILLEGHDSPVGTSGTIKPSYESGADVFSLKVLDCASAIYLNGPDKPTPDFPPFTLSDNVVMMLNTLGAVRGVPNLGSFIREARANLGRNLFSKEELRTFLAPQQFNAIADYVTCHAWVDPSTLNPDAFRPIPCAEDYPYGNPNYRWRVSQVSLPADWEYACSREDDSIRRRLPLHRISQPLGPSSFACCGGEYMNDRNDLHRGSYALPGEAPESRSPARQAGTVPFIQMRAPVNVNTASIPVLRAVLTGIHGYYLDRENYHTFTNPGRRTMSTYGLITAELAMSLADDIVAYRNRRGPFTTWQEFNSFIDALAYLNEVQKMLIKANANPNSRLAKFNPDIAMRIRFGDPDKSDLCASRNCSITESIPEFVSGYTTEFCFSSMGYYEIQSIGRVCGHLRGGARRILGEKKATAVVKLYDVLRHTTQRNFETSVRSRENVITYPESMADLASAGLSDDYAYAPRNFDGYVEVAPAERLPRNPPVFRLDFNGTLRADYARGRTTNYGPADEDRSILDYNDLSELFPDGYFSHETRRNNYLETYYASGRWWRLIYGRSSTCFDEYTRYDAVQNFPLEGALEMWVKPTWHGNEWARDIRPDTVLSENKTFFSMGDGQESGRPEESSSHPRSYTDERIGLFAKEGYVGIYYGDTVHNEFNPSVPPAPPAVYLETFSSIHYYYNWFGTSRARIDEFGQNWRAGQWNHLMLAWQRDRAWLFVNGQPARGNPLIPFYTPAFPTGIGSYWSMFVGSNRFERRVCNGFPFPADATIDMVRIYDNPTTYPLTGFTPPARFNVYASSRNFVAGFDLPRRKGQLGTISWTVYRPTNDTGEIVFSITYGGRNVDLPGGTDGTGLSLNTMPVDGESNGALDYKAEFILPDPDPDFGFVRESPILDDITITVLKPLQYLACFIE